MLLVKSQVLFWGKIKIKCLLIVTLQKVKECAEKINVYCAFGITWKDVFFSLCLILKTKI